MPNGHKAPNPYGVAMSTAVEEVRLAFDRHTKQVEGNEAFSILRSPKGRAHLALVEALFMPKDIKIERGELLRDVGSFLSTAASDEELAELFGVGTSDAKGLVDDLSRARARGGLGLIYGETDDEDRHDYFALSRLAFSAIDLARRLEGDLEVMTSTRAEIYDDLIRRATAIAMDPDGKETIAVLEEQRQRLDEKIEEIKSGQTGGQDAQLEEMLTQARHEGIGMASSVREIALEYRKQEKRMRTELMRSSTSPSDVFYRQEEWRESFESTIPYKGYVLASRLVNKRAQGVGLNLMVDAVRSRADLSRLAPLADEVWAGETDILAAMEAKARASSDWAKQKARVARVGSNPQVNKRLDEAQEALSVFTAWAKESKGRNAELPGFGYPLLRGGRRLYAYEESTGGPAGEPVAVEADEERPGADDLSAVVGRMRRLGPPSATRGAAAALEHAVYREDGRVDVAASFSAAGTDALIQDIIALTVELGRGETDPGHENSLWRGTNAGGAERRFSASAASCTLEELERMARGEGKETK